jgi:hypothetical protein
VSEQQKNRARLQGLQKESGRPTQIPIVSFFASRFPRRGAV